MAMSIGGTVSRRAAIAPRSSRHPQASIFGTPSCLSTNYRERCYFLGNRSLLKVQIQNGTKQIKMDVVVNGAEPGAPLPSDPSSGTSWKLWLAGILLSAIIPFWKNKWWPLLKLKEQVGSALQSVEDVVEMVEKVAGEVEKVADDIADHLPKGKLQQLARDIENVAGEAAKGAGLADDLIDKVQEVENEVDSIIDQAKERIKDANDTENETTKLKEATEIKKKITEIRQVNDSKTENDSKTVNDSKTETVKS